jgi:hypothetical protein
MVDSFYVVHLLFDGADGANAAFETGAEGGVLEEFK